MRKTFVIAEAGVNHNGSLDRAVELVSVAARAGADAVKFQTFKAERLVTAKARKANYQVRETGEREGQLEMLRRLELDDAQHLALKACCDEQGIEFMSTPFDLDSLHFLVDRIGVERIKVPSGEAINASLLLAIARAGLPIVLSTGMCTFAEVWTALSVLSWGRVHATGVPASSAALAAYRESADWIEPIHADTALLQCVTEYPAAAGATSLAAMQFMADRTGLDTGLSDHSTGTHVALAAVARGAVMLEKHYTLSRELPGPDHGASLEPDELSTMIAQIREVELAIGDYDKRPHACELENRVAARSSLVASRPIEVGEAFTVENLTTKRPGDGVGSDRFFDYVNGATARRAYEMDEAIEPLEP